MKIKSRSLINSDIQDSSLMQKQQLENHITHFLERKFRASRSFATTKSYRYSLVRFGEFLRIKYNLDVNQFLSQLKKNQLVPLDALDEYYTFLSQHSPKKGNKTYSNATILQYVTIAKEFLNNEGCKIYSEDLRQKFRLPKIRRILEKGFDKIVINRLLRFANPKLATVILIACSSGMRILEIVHLKLSDIDFTTTPTTITIRAVTTKTRESRITHITTEATKTLKDYLSKQNQRKNGDYLFLLKNNVNSSSEEEQLSKMVFATRENLENQLVRLIRSIPGLDTKNENGRYTIHFHAFRKWFKTQVTDAHQSDFAEVLLGHKSLKLVYYLQNDKARAKTYLDVEHSLTIADTEKIDHNYSELQKDNLELRGIVDLLSKQLRSLEKKIETSL